MVNREQTWLETRRRHLTASEVAIALGYSPFASPVELWASKRDEGPPITKQRQQVFDEGHLVEPIIKAEYSALTGHALAGVGDFEFRTHPDHHWLGGTVDDLVLDPRGVLEAKLCNDLGEAGYGDPSRGEVPLYVRIQVQIYMAVTGCEWADVQVLQAPRRHWSPLVLLGLPREERAHLAGIAWPTYRIERHDRLIAGLILRAGEWWERHVLAGDPPEATRAGDAALLYPRPTSNQTLLARTSEAKVALQRYADAHARLKDAEIEKEEAEEALKLQIGSTRGLRGAPGKASWFRVDGRKFVDGAAIVAELDAMDPADRAAVDLEELERKHTRRSSYRALRFSPRK